MMVNEDGKKLDVIEVNINKANTDVKEANKDLK